MNYFYQTWTCSTGVSPHFAWTDNPKSWSHAGEKVLFNEKDHIHKKNIVQISIKYVHIYVYRETVKILGENKSEGDIQRYKLDPYEYILNDM